MKNMLATNNTVIYISLKIFKKFLYFRESANYMYIYKTELRFYNHFDILTEEYGAFKFTA